jgi:hypothetical protein
MDVDEFDVDQGDELSCPECGTNLAVVSVTPVELDLVSDDDDEEEELEPAEAGRGLLELEDDDEDSEDELS